MRYTERAIKIPILCRDEAQLRAMRTGKHFNSVDNTSAPKGFPISAHLFIIYDDYAMGINTSESRIVGACETHDIIRDGRS